MTRARAPAAAWALGLLWLVLFIPIALLASTPTSTAVQGLLGIVVVLAVALLKPFAANHLVPRVLLLAIASLLILRYWIWRLLETLPAPDVPVSLAAALLLFAVETYAIAVFFLTAFINSDPTDRQLPPRVRAADLPSVDVLVPSYNESAEMLSVTLAAAKHMYYPREKLRVVLCDDGGTDQRCAHSDPQIAIPARARRAELQSMCHELGVTYTTRARNEHAKAGNMSAALEKIDGDLVAVFDADHVPSRDFLARTVGYFVENPRLFLVQTPHFFLNPDPIQRNLGLSDTCPAENEMFYTQIHRGLDRWGGAFFCGSAALLRRSAINDVGGFSGETITEDAETALDIHARGWESLYLNRAMIAGLQPETFASFIQQRGRWATGMVQMLLLKNPLFRPGLSILQRLCYLNSMSFWLFPVVRLSFLIIPLFYLFFGLEIFVATGQEVLAYMVSYLLVSFMVQNALFGRTRWPLVSEIYEVAQAPYLATQIFKTILRPRAAKFVVTAKDETLSEDSISPIYKPLLLLVLLLALGLALAALRWIAFPGDRTVVEVVGGWALFNFLLSALALRAVAEKQQRRGAPRVATHVSATAWLREPPDTDQEALDPGTEDPGIECVVIDASTSGARLLFTTVPHGSEAETQLSALKPAAQVMFRPLFPETPELDHRIKAEVQAVGRGSDGLTVGVHMLPNQPIVVRESVAYMIYSDSEPWRRQREDETRASGLFAGIFYILRMSLAAIPRLVADMARERGRRRRAADRSSDAQQQVHVLAFGEDFDAPSVGTQNAPRSPRDGLDFILEEERKE